MEVLGFQFKSDEERFFIDKIIKTFEIIHTNDEITDVTINYRKKKKIKIPDAVILATAKVKKVYILTANSFGFNGKEKDDEISGTTGSHLDFGAREYDSRIGRWWSCDGKADKYPSMSPYNFAGNNPILFVDPDGEEIRIGFFNRRAMKEKLQKLTADELKVTIFGKVKIANKGNSEFKRYGTNLVSELIARDKVLTIKSTTQESSINPSEGYKVGTESGAEIKFNVNKKSVLTVNDGSTVVTPPTIALGRLLIEASIYLKGSYIKSGTESSYSDPESNMPVIGYEGSFMGKSVTMFELYLRDRENILRGEQSINKRKEIQDSRFKI